MVHAVPLAIALLAAGDDPSKDAPQAAPAPIRIEGKWVLDENGRPVPPRLSGRERGLQTGALVLRKAESVSNHRPAGQPTDGGDRGAAPQAPGAQQAPRRGRPRVAAGAGEGPPPPQKEPQSLSDFRSGSELWSIGDQRAEWPGQLIRIDPKTARLIGGPIRPELQAPPGGSPLFAGYESIGNPDFEGLAADPKDPDTLYGVTEDKGLLIVRFRIAAGAPPRAAIDRITEIEFPDVRPWRGDTNYRVEGIALSDDGKTMYLAWERGSDELPGVFSLASDEGVSGKTARAKLVPVDFAAVPRRAEKPKALLNINDIAFLRREERPCLLAIARDQERLLLIDLEGGKVARSVDLDLRDPGGDSILWVSPEGLAIDEASDRLWLINDPDSNQGNYRKLKEEDPTGGFESMAPLLFETKLSAVLGVPAGR